MTCLDVRYHQKENNPMWGQHHSRETKELMSQCKRADANGVWKGDNVGYSALHEWVRKYYVKPELCAVCNIKPPFDLANKTGVYDRNFSNWQWLCRSCHMRLDGRMDKIHRGEIHRGERRKP
jgi:hypothetical protein